MLKYVIAAGVAMAPLAAADAQSMSVATFIGKVDALKKKGPMALFSGDIKVLKGEVVNSGRQLRAEQKAAQAAGRRPSTCMPEKPDASREEWLAHLEAIPPSRRGNITVKAAFADLMRKKYPCPA